MSSAHATAVVVDDDPLVLGLLSDVFEAAGFAVTTADNGTDGVRAILDTQPLVASVDLTMPGLDGIEAARRVRAGGSATHIIMISASEQESDVVLSLGAGADEYLYKPVRVRELRARIDAVLRRAEAMRAAVPEEPREAEHVAAETASVAEGAPAGGAGLDGAGLGGAGLVGAGEWSPDSAAPDDLLTHHDLVLDLTQHVLWRGDTVIELTAPEVVLLADLMRSGTAMRSKAQLSQTLRGHSESPNAYADAEEKAIVDRHMSSLFGKIELDIWRPRYIKAVQPVGYRLTAE